MELLAYLVERYLVTFSALLVVLLAQVALIQVVAVELVDFYILLLNH
jgi:hypothetical protein